MNRTTSSGHNTSIKPTNKLLSFSLLALLLAAFINPNAANAQNAEGTASDQFLEPMFLRIPSHFSVSAPPPGDSLRTWRSWFIYKDIRYDYTMVGDDPFTGGNTVTIPVYIIPVQITVYDTNNRAVRFSPLCGLSFDFTWDCYGLGIDSPLRTTIKSPLFNNLDYVQGGVDVGSTQYIDAFQRANFWKVVQNEPNYHLLLGQPIVLPEQNIVVPPDKGSAQTVSWRKNGKGKKYFVALVDPIYLMSQLEALFSKFPGIQPNALPIFMTYDTFMRMGDKRAAGGYHTSIGNEDAPQTYSWFTYADPGSFAEDVSALSHEIGEWADDPFPDDRHKGNYVTCPNPNGTRGLLEVGDPEEEHKDKDGNSTSLYVYHLNGFDYHLQDLVFLRYFGAPADTSVSSWWTFQNATDEYGYSYYFEVCQEGP
jgi:hypothetical protein